jgi:hypothetical protein
MCQCGRGEAGPPPAEPPSNLATSSAFATASWSRDSPKARHPNRDIGCRKEFGNRQKLNFVDFAAGRFGGRRKPRS